MPRIRPLLACALLLSLEACCGNANGSGDGGTAGTGGATNGGSNGRASNGGTTNGEASNGGASGGGNCADGAQWIYTVDVDNELSAFHPDTLTFADIGKLSCPAKGGATPFSMAVDRNAVAWVLYSSGELFSVNTSDATCTATSYAADQHGLDQFGMGFSADQTTQSANGTDTLFLAGGAANQSGTASLATLAFPALTVTTVGTVSGWPELTGTGDGELWGFSPSNQGTSSTPTLSQIDKTKGSNVATFQLSSIAGSPHAWAQGFYGGSFWIFLQRSSDASTYVYEVQRADGGLTTAVPNTGRTIAGAGVSTCAPVTFE